MLISAVSMLAVHLEIHALTLVTVRTDPACRTHTFPVDVITVSAIQAQTLVLTVQPIIPLRTG